MKKLLFTLTAVICFFQAPAQTERALTFDEAIQMTLTNNPSMLASRYEEEAAFREKQAAFGLRMPQIGVTGTYAFLGDDIGIGFNELKEPVGDILGGIGGFLPPEILQQAQQLLSADWSYKIQERSFGSVAATATLPLYTGGKINAANNAAAITYRTTQQKGAQSRNSLVTQLTERYYGLLLAMRVVDVRKEVLDGMEHHYRDALELEKNGIVSRGERLYAEVFVAEAKRELYSAEKQAETIQKALSNTLNSDLNHIPVSNMFVLGSIESVGYYHQLAMNNSPILKQVNLTKDLANEGVRLQRSEFAPQVAAMGMASLYRYQVSSAVPKWAVGAGVTFNIFDGLNREHKYGAARSKVRQAEAFTVKAENDITTLITQIYNEMSSIKSQLTTFDTSLAAAEEYLRISEEGFKEGVTSSADVVDARLNLARIKTERLQTVYAYDLLLAGLLEACGESERMADYGKRADAVPVTFENTDTI